MFDDLRAAWGAREPARKPAFVAPAKRTGFMAHYDGGAALNLPAHADCLRRVKQDQDFHMDGRGWSDIGYNGLVCQHGRAIEGRGIDYAGAHCPDHNTTAYGWQFMVGGAQVPTPAAYTRMARAYADCLLRTGHGLAKLGHRDGFATECPGTAIQAWVKAGMNAPTTVAPPAPEEDFMDVKNPITGEHWPAEQALWSIWSYSINAARDAAVARGLAEASARAGAPLTVAEIDDIANATLDALDGEYDATVTLTPKPE